MDERIAFERSVAETAYRPRTPEAALADLEGQLLYLPEPTAAGLPELAAALAALFGGRAEKGLRGLVGAAREHQGQPLCHYYLFAAHRARRDAAAAAAALSGLERVDSTDPMVMLIRLHLEGKPPPDVSEEIRLANIGKFAATPLLRNPYRLAVGAIFEAIREDEHARVLDVGVGSGAQMSELVALLDEREHRLQRLEIIGLDIVEDFLETAGRSIASRAAALTGRVEITYRPILGAVETLEPRDINHVLAGGPLNVANATISLHEVPGEAKLAALRNLRALAPGQLVIAEWNYCLENVLPETSVEFLFNIRRATAAMVAALRERYPFEESRAVARDWLSLARGQLTCPAAARQECFLDATTWKALLERCGFRVLPVAPGLLDYAEGAEAQVWSIATSRYASAAPIVLLQAKPSGA